MTIDRAIEIMAGSADVDYTEWAQARKMGVDALREKKERVEVQKQDGDGKCINAVGLKNLITQKVFKNLTDEYWGVMQAIDEMPNEIENPVEHGEWWDEYGTHEVAKCSQCGATFGAVNAEDCDKDRLWTLFKHDYSYCPNCGAEMDGEE